jgi:predicted transcriptional regulator
MSTPPTNLLAVAETVQISFRAAPELRRRLRQAALDDDIDLQTILNQSAEQWLERRDKVKAKSAK